MEDEAYAQEQNKETSAQIQARQPISQINCKLVHWVVLIIE